MSKPIAYARRWFVENETPHKEKNSKGRMALAIRFKFLPVTPHRVFPDDIPLYADAQEQPK